MSTRRPTARCPRLTVHSPSTPSGQKYTSRPPTLRFTNNANQGRIHEYIQNTMN